MERLIQEVAIGHLDLNGRERCIYCDARLRPGFPVNYPQVCHPCADEHVWHYCDNPHPRQQPPHPQLREG